MNEGRSGSRVAGGDDTWRSTPSFGRDERVGSSGRRAAFGLRARFERVARVLRRARPFFPSRGANHQTSAKLWGFPVGTPTPRGDRRARLWTSTDMSHFPGRAPPAPPSGFDDSGLDMRAIKQAGGKVLPGEHSQIAKLQKPNRFIPPSAPRSPSARPLTTHPDSYRVNPQAATA